MLECIIVKMNSNLPEGVYESIFGAPWNDQEYACKFHFKLDTELNGITLYSCDLVVSFVLPGPKKYHKTELEEIAVETIKRDYINFLSDYCEITIAIDSIYEE